MTGAIAAFDEISGVAVDHLAPAVAGLDEAALHGDADAVRALALEIAMVAASVAASCPRTRAHREPCEDVGRRRRLPTSWWRDR